MGRIADEIVRALRTSTLLRFAASFRTPHQRLSLAAVLTLVAVMTSGPSLAADSIEGEPEITTSTSAKLDQARNGRVGAPRSPVEFQNGNAGPSNSHYVEGLSIPYRLVLSKLALGTHTVTIEWDITAQRRHAIDYITSVNRLQPHDLFSPPHAAETVNPLAGLSGSFGAPTTFPIPAPSSSGSPSPGQPAASFNALPASERMLTMYNGVITAASYVSQGSLTGSNSESRLRITFTANSPNVVLAWGGHIASRGDWGAGNSAANINGSPYHTRLIDLDGKGGNQDRSLQASAVLSPLVCTIAGPATACPGGINVYESAVPAGSYLWTVSGDATIVGAADKPTVQVLAKTGCGGGDYTVTLRLSGSDACASTCSQKVTLQDIIPPVLVCPPDLTLECGASIDPEDIGFATATDACTPNVTVTFGDASAGPAVAFAGATCVPRPPIQRTWTATDACGNVTTCVQTISFVDTKPPVLTCPNLDVIVECGQPYDPATIGAATATDDCDPNVTVTFGDASAGPAVAFSGATCVPRAPIQRTWTATDDCGNVTTCVQTITFVDKRPPVLSCPADIVVECGGAIDPSQTGVATAQDGCDANVTVTFGDASAGPSAAFSAATCVPRPPIQRTWTATDACGNVSTCVQIISFKDTKPPVLTCPNLDVTVECGQPYDPPTIGAATAVDDCDPNVTVTFGDASAAPPSSAAACQPRPPIQRTWTATDDCGNVITCVQTITFVDTKPPVITCPALDVIVECGQPYDPATIGAATATDGCDPDVTVTFGDASAAPGVAFSAASCTPRPPIQRTWTATDACGNVTTCVQTITFRDTQPPVLTCPNLDVTVECGQPYDPPTIGAATAVDDCDPNVTVTFGDASAAPAASTATCEGRPPVHRTWTATDACGNVTTCVQLITFVDTTPPSITCPPKVVRPLCDNVVSWKAEAEDGCDAAPQVTFDPPSGTAFPPGLTLVTGTAVDACGNSATCSFTVVVNAPVIKGPSTVCKGSKAELCGPDGAVSYAWTGPGGFSAAERCVDVTAPGAYELVVTFPGVACATKIDHLLALADPPVCSITGPERPCSGGPVNLCGPEGELNYAWTGPGDFKADTRCVAVSIGGDYHLTITDQNLGCTSTCEYKLELVACEPGSVAASEPDPLRRKAMPTTDVQAQSDLKPTLELGRPSPNPFTSATRIAYDVPEGGREAMVAIYDVAGRNVRTLASGAASPGRHEVTWNGRDAQGAKVTSGVYFVRIVAGGKARTMPVVYLGR